MLQGQESNRERHSLDGDQGDYVRFTLDRAFDPPLAIHLDMGKRRLEVTSGLAAGPTPVVVAVERAFVGRICRMVASQYLGADPPEERLGLDGATWGIEVRWAGEYHASEAWSPDRGAEYELGRLLFRRAASALPLGDLY